MNTPKNQPRCGEVPLKSFVQDESDRTGLSKSGVLKRVHAGYYRNLRLRSVNRRVVYCTVMATA